MKLAIVRALIIISLPFVLVYAFLIVLGTGITAAFIDAWREVRINLDSVPGVLRDPYSLRKGR